MGTQPHASVDSQRQVAPSPQSVGAPASPASAPASTPPSGVGVQRKVQKLVLGPPRVEQRMALVPLQSPGCWQYFPTPRELPTSPGWPQWHVSEWHPLSSPKGASLVAWSDAASCSEASCPASFDEEGDWDPQAERSETKTARPIRMRASVASFPASGKLPLSSHASWRYVPGVAPDSHDSFASVGLSE